MTGLFFLSGVQALRHLLIILLAVTFGKLIYRNLNTCNIFYKKYNLFKMPDCPASGQSNTGITKADDGTSLGPDSSQSGIGMLRYRTEMSKA